MLYFDCHVPPDRSRLSRLFYEPPEQLLLDLLSEGFRYKDCRAAAKRYTSREAAIIYLEQLEREELILALRKRGFYRPHCEKALDLWPDVTDALQFLQHQKHGEKEDVDCVFCSDPELLEEIPKKELNAGVKLKLD